MCVHERLEKGEGLCGLPERHPDAELEVETGARGALTPIWGFRPRQLWARGAGLTRGGRQDRRPHAASVLTSPAP